jgi:hypothetical protein
MSKTDSGGSRQRELFPRSKRSTITLADDHPMVVLTDRLDWTALEETAEAVRSKKLKSRAGRPPHLRVLVGAVILMALRKRTYRETEEQIRYYVPARYLCGLTETEWTPDFTTIQDFAALMGEDGVEEINGQVVDLAVELGLCDPQEAVADTTAQEAAIPYPNEMGLLGSFVRTLQTTARRAGQAMKSFVKKVGGQLKAAKEKVREYRLFAKAKEQKDRILSEMVECVEGVVTKLGKALEASVAGAQKLRKYARVARRKMEQLYETTSRLLPQIRYWLRTGRVAAGKIISLHMPELYALVRNKVGKAVEFGLLWGITRLGGGYVLARRSMDKKELVDARYAVRAVEDHILRFGRAPRAYAYDRAGYSEENLLRLRKLGVRHVGLAPRGRKEWPVKGRMREKLIRARAQVEGSIGTLKSRKYGFNRPAERSVPAMGLCGQRAVLGFNLNKLVRELKAREAAAQAA